jgi:hypothetical protein
MTTKIIHEMTTPLHLPGNTGMREGGEREGGKEGKEKRITRGRTKYNWKPNC